MSQHIDFLGTAIDIASKLERTSKGEVLLLRRRATALVQKLGGWASVEPSPEERVKTIGELLSLNRDVEEYMLREKAREI